MANILFICTANLNRSRTAEDIFRDKYNVKSAGLLCRDTELTTALTKGLIDWADLVFVFEHAHVNFLKQNYPDLSKKIVNLQVPDVYPYGDPELVNLLKDRIEAVINKINEISTGHHDYSSI